MFRIYEKQVVKVILLCLVGFFVLGLGYANAEDKLLYPTVPGTEIRDYSKPGYIIKGKNIYPTYPGTDMRDYSRPGYKIEKDSIYPTYPGTDMRDFTKPGYKIQDDPFGSDSYDRDSDGWMNDDFGLDMPD